MTELVAETAIMKIFHHPNVLQLLGVCVDNNDDEMLKAVLPYMANGDLGNFLKQKRIDPMNISEFANVRFVINICIYVDVHIYVIQMPYSGFNIYINLCFILVMYIRFISQ